MNSGNKFLDLNFLSESSRKESREILKKVFLINFKEPEELFGEEFLENMCEWYKIFEEEETNKINPEKWFKNINLENDIDEILKKLHNACMYIIEKWLITIRECFPNILNENMIMRSVDDYIFQNIKNNIVLYDEFKKVEENEIYFVDGVKKYIKFKKNFYYNFDENNKDDDKNKKIIEDAESALRNKQMRFRKGTKEELSLKKIDIEYIFVNYKKMQDFHDGKVYMYNATSNIYFNMIDNYSICKYYNKNEAYTTSNYKNTLKFINEFLKNEITFIDLYFFERIHNNYFIMNLFLNTCKIGKLIVERDSMVRCMFPVIYLPNVFESEGIIYSLISEYNASYRNNSKEFEEGVKKLCLELSFFGIPLYNMVFANILEYFCNIKELNIDEFISRIASENREKIANNFISQYKYFQSIEHKNKLNNRVEIEEKTKEKNLKIMRSQDFKNINRIISERLNFDEFEKTNINKALMGIGDIFPNGLKDNKKYYEVLKKFIMDIFYIE